MDEHEFKKRTKRIALDAIRLVDSLPRGRSSDVIGKQLLRSATSIGANYRAACRAKSKADLIAKLAIVEEQADESLYWMELLLESGLASQNHLAELMHQTDQIVAMVVASIKTLRGYTANNPKSKT
ncbi:MAG TPA: four helix bundle protein [Chloroflexia bacterium]|jgi:four helix bundle protein